MKKLISVFVAMLTAFSMLFALIGCEGETGKKGENGKSAYEIWLDQGHVGDKDVYLEWLRGGKCNSGGGCSCYPKNEEENPKGDGFEMPENGFDVTQPVTITFAHTMWSALRGILDSAIERFNVLYPNITVEQDNTTLSYDDLLSKVSIGIRTGTQPNLAFCYPDHVALYNRAEAVLPLDDFLPNGAYKNMTVTSAKGEQPLGLTREQLDDYIPAYFAEGSVYGDDKTYTLPFAKSTEFLYYNKKFFQDHPSLTEPTGYMTWDEIFDLCANIKAIDKNCTPLGIDSESNLFITLCEQSRTPYTSATGDHYLFNTAENKAFVQKFYDWYKADYFTTKSIYKAYVSGLFTNQKCYLGICSSGSAQRMTSDNFEVGILPVPQMDPENPKVISLGPNLCILKNEDPQEVLASWLFAKFITTDLAFQASYSMISDYLPVIQSVFNHPVYQDFLASESGTEDGITARAIVTSKRLAEDGVFFTTPAFVGSATARQEVGNLLVAVLNGKTIEQAFSDAIAECKGYT